MPVFEIDENEDLFIYLKSLGKHDSIYISLGGKQNESIVSLSETKVMSNAPYQMVPQFLRGGSEEKSLILIIDTFRQEEAGKINRRILNQLSTPFTDIVMLNCEITVHGLSKLVNVAIEIAKLNNIAPSRYMFCNYVKFYHPNDSELNLEMIIPEALQICHNKTIYRNGFYQWYGYNTQLYNTIYCYKKYQTAHLCHFVALKQILSKLKNMQLSINTIMMLQMEDFKKEAQKILSLFMEYNYDITANAYDASHLATNYMKGTVCFTKVYR
jgi:hypothetical protein